MFKKIAVLFLGLIITGCNMSGNKTGISVSGGSYDKTHEFNLYQEDENAFKYDEITYLDILNKDLKVMDSTATSLCRDNQIPLIVFGINEPENMVKIIKETKY